jgi:hypothetical protein
MKFPTNHDDDDAAAVCLKQRARQAAHKNLARISQCIGRADGRMKSGILFIYPFTELFKSQSMNQRGSFSSYCHIGVCIILKEVIQVSKRFLLTLRGSWRVIDLFFRKSLLVPHVLPIPTVHWTIILPPSSLMFDFG